MQRQHGILSTSEPKGEGGQLKFSSDNLLLPIHYSSLEDIQLQLNQPITRVKYMLETCSMITQSPTSHQLCWLYEYELLTAHQMILLETKLFWLKFEMLIRKFSSCNPDNDEKPQVQM